MIQTIKKLFKSPTVLDVATKELKAAKLSRLVAQSQQEYAAGIVAYRNQQIDRLERIVAETTH